MNINTNNFKIHFKELLKIQLNIDVSIENLPNRYCLRVNDLSSKQDILYVAFDNNPHHFNMNPTFRIYAAHQSDIYLLKKIYDCLPIPSSFRSKIIHDFYEVSKRYPFLEESNINLFTNDSFIKPFNCNKVVSIQNNQNQSVWGLSNVIVSSIPLFHEATVTIINKQTFSISNDNVIGLVDEISINMKSMKNLKSTVETSSNYASYRWSKMSYDYTVDLLELMSQYVSYDVLNAYGEKKLYELTAEEIKNVIEISEMFNI